MTSSSEDVGRRPASARTVRLVESRRHRTRLAGVALEDIQALELFAAHEVRGGPITVAHACRRGLFLRDPDGRPWVYTGLVYRLNDALIRGGYDVELYGPETNPHYQFADDGPLADERLGSCQRDFLHVTNGRARSLAVVPCRRQRVDLLEAICQRFPYEAVLAVVPSMPIVKSVASVMAERTERPVFWGEQPIRVLRPVLQVDTVNSHYGGYPISVFLGRDVIRTQRVRKRLRRNAPGLRFAVLEVPLETLDRWERLDAEAYFGRNVFAVSEIRDPFTTVSVAWLPAPAYRAVDPSRSMLQLKRQAVWHNDDRNRLLAKVAQGLRAGDQGVLQACGIDRVQDVVTPSHGQSALSVVVVVETAEHARAIARYLSGWQVMTAYDQAPPDLFLEVEQHIVTLAIAAAHDLVADVVVYAAGVGDRWPQGRGSFSILNGPEMLVVDVADDVDPRLVGDGAGRNRHYARQAWRIHGWRARILS